MVDTISGSFCFIDQIKCADLLCKFVLEYFKDLNILAFKKLVIQRILLLLFKHNIGIVPKLIASLFTKKK